MRVSLMTLSALCVLASGCQPPPQYRIPIPPTQPDNIPANSGGLGQIRPIAPKGLEYVMGQDANSLRQLFGEPRLDVREEVGRKLQFAGAPCVLDVYLYPDTQGRETVTHIDARRSDGAEVDKASCVNALQQR